MNRADAKIDQYPMPAGYTWRTRASTKARWATGSAQGPWINLVTRGSRSIARHASRSLRVRGRSVSRAVVKVGSWSESRGIIPPVMTDETGAGSRLPQCQRSSSHSSSTGAVHGNRLIIRTRSSRAQRHDWPGGRSDQARGGDALLSLRCRNYIFRVTYRLTASGPDAYLPRQHRAEPDVRTRRLQGGCSLGSMVGDHVWPPQRGDDA